jgi:hypothetical protein
VKPSARVDLTAGFAVVAIGALGLSDVLARPPVAHGMAGDPGPAFLPSVLLWLLVGLGVVIMLAAVLRLYHGAPGASAGPVASPGDAWLARVAPTLLPVLMVVSVAAYVVTLPRLGFLPVTLAFLLLWGALVGLVESGGTRRLWLVPIEAVLITGLLVLLFRIGLRVPLP